MNTKPSLSLELARDEALDEQRAPTELVSPSRIGEARQRNGKRMIFAGFGITILGVVLYCAACFAGGMDAEMGDILLRNVVPFARATLAVVGLGTLVWLVGSFTYLRGAMDADEQGSGEQRD